VVKTRRFTFQVFPTPGHSHDHVCFYEPERRWLFGGDLFLGSHVPVARSWENSLDLIASLERVTALQPRVFICYHRGPLADPQAALAKKLSYLCRLRDQIDEFRRQGMPALAIARRLLGREPLSYFITRGDFSKVKLVQSFLKAPGGGYEVGL